MTLEMSLSASVSESSRQNSRLKTLSLRSAKPAPLLRIDWLETASKLACAIPPRARRTAMLRLKAGLLSQIPATSG
jgi:hypothetical protein